MPVTENWWELVAEFLNELRSRCDVMNEKQKRALVLELLAQDAQSGLDAAVAEKRQEVTRFLEGLWDKYAAPLDRISASRDATSKALGNT